MSPAFDQTNPPESAGAPAAVRGVEHAHVIDLVADDSRTGEAVLIMLEPRPWDATEQRLFQLQEKINAYLSFALDGEMAEAYPALANRPLRLQLDCAGMPGADVVGFLSTVREQIAFQGINFGSAQMGETGGGPIVAGGRPSRRRRLSALRPHRCNPRRSGFVAVGRAFSACAGRGARWLVVPAACVRTHSKSRSPPRLAAGLGRTPIRESLVAAVGFTRSTSAGTNPQELRRAHRSRRRDWPVFAWAGARRAGGFLPRMRPK